MNICISITGKITIKLQRYYNFLTENKWIFDEFFKTGICTYSLGSPCLYKYWFVYFHGHVLLWFLNKFLIISVFVNINSKGSRVLFYVVLWKVILYNFLFMLFALCFI